jgi:hypothetical protein
VPDATAFIDCRGQADDAERTRCEEKARHLGLTPPADLSGALRRRLMWARPSRDALTATVRRQSAL